MSKYEDIVSILANVDKDKQAVFLFTGDKCSSLMISIAIEQNIKTVFIDSGYHFAEINEYVKSFGDRIEVVRNSNASADPLVSMDVCCSERKSEVLNDYLKKSNAACLIVPFLDDERDNGIEESYLKGINKIEIVRPFAGFSCRDVWIQIKKEGVHFSKIYNKGYSIVECKCCTTRHGRRKESEHISDNELERETEEKLKDLGYM